MIQNNITAITIVLAAVLTVAVVLAVYLFWRIRRLEGECELLLRDARGQNFVEIVNDNIAHVERLMGEVDGLSERYAWVLRRMAGAVQHVGVVRFDAFRDLGGLLSFAVALLDDRGNGLVMSSIYGRSDSRTYTKPIVERGSKYELSPEEREAIHLAMQSKERGALPVEAKDTEHDERMANLRLFHDKELAEAARRQEAGVESDESLETPRERQQKRPPGKPAQGRELDRMRTAGAEARQQQPRASVPAPLRSRSKPAGRVTHVRPVERTPERKRLEQKAERGGGPGPSEEKQAGRPKAPPAEQAKKPAEEGTRERAREKRTGTTRPQGLDTPVERLRGKKPGGP